jgi:hypothetical protein
VNRPLVAPALAELRWEFAVLPNEGPEPVPKFAGTLDPNELIGTFCRTRSHAQSSSRSDARGSRAEARVGRRARRATGQVRVRRVRQAGGECGEAHSDNAAFTNACFAITRTRLADADRGPHPHRFGFHSRARRSASAIC